jgi:hypothetical protein
MVIVQYIVNYVDFFLLYMYLCMNIQKNTYNNLLLIDRIKMAAFEVLLQYMERGGGWRKGVTESPYPLSFN